MNNTDNNSSRNNTARLGLGVAASITVCFLAAAFLSATVLLCSRGNLLSAFPTFALSVTFSAIAFKFVRNPAVILPPILASVSCIIYGVDAEAVIFAVCSAVLLGAFIAVCTLRRTPLFAMHLGIICITLVISGALMCMILVSAYGSVGSGITTLTEEIRLIISSSLDEMQLDEATALSVSLAVNAVVDNISLLIPSALAVVSAVVSYMILGFLAIAGKAMNTYPVFFGREWQSSALLGGLYIILSFFSLFADSASVAYFVITNICCALTAVFVLDSVRRIIRLIRRARAGKRRTLIIIVIVTAVIMQSSLITLLAYFGALGAVIESVRAVVSRRE